jgi:zinc protease
MKPYRRIAAHFSFRCAVAAVLLALAGPMAAEEQAPPPARPAMLTGVPVWSIPSPDLPADTSIRFGILPNGMRYALMRNTTPPGGAALRFTIDAGARDELEGELGFAHFVEHMAFNGSANIPEGDLVKQLERLGLQFGIDSNAETNFDYTTYKFDLPHADDEALETGLAILREIAGNLTIAPDAVERERRVIEAETSTRDLPQRRRSASLLKAILPDSGLAERLSASREAIGATTAQGLRAFYEGYYRPERATLVMVGDFDIDQAERKIRAHFEDWHGTGSARPDYALRPVPAGGPAVATFVDPAIPEAVELDRVSDYAPPGNSIAETRDEVLKAIASFALTNRLNAISRQPGAAILGGQWAQQELFRSAKTAGIYVLARDGEWKQALQLAEQEMRRAQEFGFTDAELDEAKANLAAALANAVQQKTARQSAAIAAQITRSSLEGSVPIAPEIELALYQSLAPTLTREAVHEAFRNAWAGGPTAVHVSARQAIPDADRSIAAALAESQALAVTAPAEQQAAAFAYTDFGPAGTIVADRRIDDLGIREVTFANGVQLNLKRTAFEPGKLAFQMTVGNGLAAFPLDKPGLPLMLLLATPLDGFEAHGPDELRRILAGRSVSLGLVGGSDAIMAQGQTTAADLELQLQLLAATLTAEGFRPESQARWASTMPVLTKTMSANPYQVLGLAMEFVFSGSDGRMGMSGPEALTALSLSDLKDALKPQLDDGPVALALVGEFDESAAIATVAKTLGALPQRAGRVSADALPAVHFTAERGVHVLNHAGTADQGAIAIAWPTTDDSDLRSTLSRTLLAGIFQLRLTAAIREDLGASYSPQAISTASDTFEGYGHITASATAQPSVMDLIADTTMEIAADLARTPPSDDELVRARLPLVEQFERQSQTNAGWTGMVARAVSNPELRNRHARWIETLQSIGPAEIQASATNWLGGDPLQIRVLPKTAP